jgi:thioredoxin-dependent peroxiredoxin
VMPIPRDAPFAFRDKTASGRGRFGRYQMKKLLAAAAFATAAIIGAGVAAPAFAALANGAKAPEFSATGMLAGKEFTFKLSDALKKGPVVAFFFPAAYTSGCTAEAKAFSDAADQFKAAGATLVGLTGGARLADGTMASAAQSLARLEEFSKEHCRDKFAVAAVTSDTVKAYDVSLNDQRPDWSNRTSYVIAPDGKILLAHTDMGALSHIEKTLEAVKAYKTAHAAHAGH